MSACPPSLYSQTILAFPCTYAHIESWATQQDSTGYYKISTFNQNEKAWLQLLSTMAKIDKKSSWVFVAHSICPLSARSSALLSLVQSPFILVFSWPLRTHPEAGHETHATAQHKEEEGWISPHGTESFIFVTINYSWRKSTELSLLRHAHLFLLSICWYSMNMHQMWLNLKMSHWIWFGE